MKRWWCRIVKFEIFRLMKILFILTIATSAIQYCVSEPVTCGSVLKLVHKLTGHHLHSHPIAWGSGSGQQSVTTTGSNNDAGSLWIVKEASSSDTCDVGTPIKCGDTVRLEHVSTGKNLHSHLFKAPLSGNQEVSGFGGENSGRGDSGDNWKVICEPGESFWDRGSHVSFSHADTNKLLFSSGAAKFTTGNCGAGCPIMGQNEVSAGSEKKMETIWKSGQGVYFTPKTTDDRLSGDDEL